MWPEWVRTLSLNISSHLESLEALLDMNRRIRLVEGIILKMSKNRKLPDEDMNTRLIKLLDDVQMLIDDVEVRANELDIQLSAIERLS